MTVHRITHDGGFRPPENPLGPVLVVVCILCGSGALAVGVAAMWPASAWVVGLVLTVVMSVVSVLAQYWFGR